MEKWSSKAQLLSPWTEFTPKRSVSSHITRSYLHWHCFIRWKLSYDSISAQVKARVLSEGLQSPAQSGPWTPLEVLLSHPSPQAPSSHSDLLVCSMNILGALPPQDFSADYSFCLEFFPPIYLHNLLTPHLLLPLFLCHPFTAFSGILFEIATCYSSTSSRSLFLFFLLYCSPSHLQPPDILCIYVLLSVMLH